MERRFPSLIILIALFALTASTAWAGAKVQVCHIPPGNPDNFHTLTVSQNAVQAHLGHGDLVGACASNCEALCSEDNSCTTGECSCACVGAVPDFAAALNGEFGPLTLCQQSLFPEFGIDSVTLTTSDGHEVTSVAGPAANGCSLRPGDTLFLSQDQALACSALLRRTAVAASLTCGPF